MKGKKFITIISIVCILAVMLCVSAFATVTESDGNGYALYNGLKSPDLFSSVDDSASYPNVIITVYAGDYSVYFTTFECYRNGSSLYAGSYGSYSKYLLSNGSLVRPINPTGTVGEGGLFVGATPVWSNYDILNSDGSIYLAASTPISLDGYNIIEWDGDTAGLESIYVDGYWRLASYEYAVDALAVWNGSTRSVQTSYYSDAPLWFVKGSGATGVANGETVIIAGDGTSVSGVSVDGIGAYKVASYYPSLIAYRTTETPPDEGSGDDSDDPQPPFGG